MTAKLLRAAPRKYQLDVEIVKNKYRPLESL